MLVKKLLGLGVSESCSSYEDEREFYREVVRYLCKLSDNKKLIKSAKRCNIGGKLKEFRINCLNGTDYTLSKFWRAVYSTQQKRCETCSFLVGCQKLESLIPLEKQYCSSYEVDKEKIEGLYGVTPRDVDLSLSLLKKSDRKLIHKKAKKYDVEYPEWDQEKSFLKLYNWCKGLVYNKLRFIIKSNPDLELEDLTHDLMIEAWVRALECDSIKDEKFFINSIKRRINQRMINLIDFYKAEKRSELIEDANGDCKIRTFSTDFEYSDSDSRCSNLGDYLSEDDAKYEEFEFVDNLFTVVDNMGGMEYPYKRFASIVLGSKDPEFEAYLEDKNVTSDYHFVLHLRKFLGISENDIKEKFTKPLRYLGFKV